MRLFFIKPPMVRFLFNLFPNRISFLFIVLILAATADFGRAFFTFLALRDAAQEGAVYASICPRNGVDIIDRARTTSRWPVDLNDPAISIKLTFQNPSFTCTDVGATHDCDAMLPAPNPGTLVVIEVVHTNFPVTMPFLGGIIGSQTIPIRAVITDAVLRNDVCN